MIILEGPDGSGKSTLAQALCAELGLVYEHTGPPLPGDPPLFRLYQARLQNAPANTCFDRLFHGEAVYGPLMRGSSQLTSTQLAYLELEAACAGALMVWCRAEPQDLVDRGDPIYKKVEPLALLDGYSQQIIKSRLPAVIYDSSRASLTNVVHLIKSLYTPRRFRWSFPGVGRPDRATVALIGDRYPGRWSEHDDWSKAPLRYLRPFDNSRSGHYLLSTLLKTVDYSPNRVYLTNARKQGWCVELQDELNALPQLKRVVCLGREAEEVVGKLHLPRVQVATTFHPQYWSRFNHADRDQYRKQLVEACGWVS